MINLNVAKTDYCVNCGDQQSNQNGQGPTAGATSYPNGTKDVPPKLKSVEYVLAATGISFQLSKISIQDVTDGTTYTLCVAEKYMPRNRWISGAYNTDNEHMYVGYDNDLFRDTNAVDWPPQPDSFDPTGSVLHEVYGSAHSSSFNASFCDGSTRRISYKVDQIVYQYMGNRKDGQPIALD